MEECVVTDEVVVLNSISNLLSDAVKWTTKKRYSLHQVIVQDDSEMAERKTLTELIQEMEQNVSSWPPIAKKHPPDGGCDADSFSEDLHSHITTLKYISELSNKMLETCGKEPFKLNQDDFTALGDKKGHLIPKRVKEEITSTGNPKLSKDLVTFLNEMEDKERERDVESPRGIDHAEDGNTEELNHENTMESSKENAAQEKPKLKKKKLKQKERKADSSMVKKPDSKKDNVFIKYKCFECEDQVDLGDKKSFKNHWNTFHLYEANSPMPKLRCKTCKKDFCINNNAAAFSNTSEANVSTATPNITIGAICQYLLHLVVNHGEEMPSWINCHKCDATDCKFVALDEFSLECHHKMMKYECAQCGMHFTKKQRRTSHMMSKHSDRPPEGRSKRLNYSEFKCFICTTRTENIESCEIFPDTDALTDHVKEFHTGKTEFKGESRDYLQCTVCLKQIILEPRKANNYMISRGLAALLHHMVSTHQVPIPPFIEPVKCPGCTILFVHMEALLAHSRSHADKITGLPKKNQCYKCGKFIKVSALNCHLRICQVPADKRASFCCPVCNENFMTRSGMTRHLKANHTGENNFLCHLCTNVYKSKYALQYHMHRAHQFRAPGAEVFHCQVISCSYSSILASDVKKHEMRVHNIGEPPAECNVCGKKVKLRYLKKHQSLHNKQVTQCSSQLLMNPPITHNAPVHNTQIDMLEDKLAMHRNHQMLNSQPLHEDLPMRGKSPISQNKELSELHKEELPATSMPPNMNEYIYIPISMGGPGLSDPEGMEVNSHHHHQRLDGHQTQNAPLPLPPNQSQLAPGQNMDQSGMNPMDHTSNIGRLGLPVQMVYNHFMH